MPSKDPIGEAFGVSQDKPKPKPVVAAQSQSGWLNQLLTIGLIGLVCFLTYKQLAPIDGDRDDQHHERKQDDKREGDKKQDSKLAPKAGWLHVVRERQTPTPDEQDAYSKLSELVPAWAKAGGFSLEIRDTDDDEPSAPVRKMVEHAKSKGIDPPFVLYKTLDNELKGVIKLPAPTASEPQFLEVFK